MSESSSICLACGLCCDGTLIGFVQLNPDEKPKLGGLFDENGIFIQPCKKYCNGCTIYEERPIQCGLFKCGLLTSVEQQGVTFDAAVESVKEVKVLKANIELELATLTITLASDSFFYKILELKKLFNLNKIKPDDMEDFVQLKLVMQKLDDLLLKEFELTF